MCVSFAVGSIGIQTITLPPTKLLLTLAPVSPAWIWVLWVGGQDFRWCFPSSCAWYWYRMKSCWSLSFGGVCTMHCPRLRKVTFEPVDAIQKRIEDVVRVQSDKTDPEELRQSHFMSHLSFKAFGSLANERMWKIYHAVMAHPANWRRMIGQAWSRLTVTWSRCIWEPFCCRKRWKNKTLRGSARSLSMLCGDTRHHVGWEVMILLSDTQTYDVSPAQKRFDITCTTYSILVQYDSICTCLLCFCAFPERQKASSSQCGLEQLRSKALYFKFVAWRGCHTHTSFTVFVQFFL